MKTILETALAHFSDAMGIPIYLYRAGTMVSSFPEEAASYPPPPNYVEAAKGCLNDPSQRPFIYTRSSAVFGFVPVTEEEKAFLLIGPIPMLFYAENDMQQIFLHYGISKEQQGKCRAFFCGIPAQSFSLFGKKLEMIHYILNQDRPRMDFNITADAAFSDRILKAGIENTYQQNTFSDVNDSLHYEAILTGIVEMGNLKELEKIGESFFGFNYGTVAETPLRNIRNLIIALITLLARAAIRGGLDAQTALHLSDLFIQNTEKAQTRDELFQVIYSCLLTYTTQVSELQSTVTVTGDVEDIIRYVRDHVNLPLTCSYLSQLFGYNSSYLSKKFKKETGMGFAEFITMTKLKDSKKLLKHTKRSLAEISFYYCFSSQSHFQNAFKKQFGITPQRYRLNAKSALKEKG